MIEFTPLENAALLAIFGETPEFDEGLRCQLEVAIVGNRNNTGAGFYTDIVVPASAGRLECPRILGQETHARVDGLKYGLGFVLFMEDGRLHQLEGYCCGGEDTSDLPLSDLSFRIADTPF